MGNEFSGHSGGSVVQSGSIQQVHIHTANSQQPTAPRQLPPITSLFTGRAHNAAWLDERWAQAVAERAGALFVISGTAGVGKTSFAAWWLQAHAEEFPDGQLYADLESYSQPKPIESEDILGGFLRALGVAPDRVPGRLAERVALLRTVTHGRRVCVLLDNALSAAQVRILAVTAPGCTTLVTTRGAISGLTMDGAIFHQLDPWRADTSVAFIQRALGAARVDQEPDAARRVAELCGGLPLALGVAAAKLAARPRWTIGRLAEALAHDGERLEVLDVGKDSAVMPALDGSYQVLDEDLAHLYRALGRCPVLWFDLAMVAAVMNSTIENAEDRLDALVDANLLEALDDRYRFHDLVRLHAAHCADMYAPSREGDEALGRLLDYFLAAATASEELMTPSHRILARDYRYEPVASVPFRATPEALEWLLRQRQNLIAAVRYCARRELYRPAWQLVDAMWPLFLRLRHTEDRLEAATLAVHAAREDGDKAAEASLSLSLSSALLGHERRTEALDCLDRAMDLYTELGDDRGLGQVCNTRAKLHARFGEWAEAEEFFLRALDLRERVGYRRGVALTYQGLGRVAAARSQLDRAEDLLRRSYEGLLNEGDRYDAAWSQALCAQAVADRGDTDRALRLLDEATAEMDTAGSTNGRAGLLEISGRIYQRLGDEDAAMVRFEQAADLFASSDPTAAKRLNLRLAGALDAKAEPAASRWQI
ncbi:MAG TPA: tetratricopeptide repeat protein [Actinospica sp.]|nr:tetratricopeptide repeat protein [Actinospica sp.]